LSSDSPPWQAGTLKRRPSCRRFVAEPCDS
jgi:hypothetical protein